MALKMDLKAILILDLYDILLQIATWTVRRGPTITVLGVF